MAKSSKKSTRKFASSGQLQKTIQARRKQQQLRKKIEKRGAAKRSVKSPGPRHAEHERDSEDEDEDEDEGVNKGVESGMSVDDFLAGSFMAKSESDGDGLGDNSEEDDNASFASVDDIEDDEGLAHVQELSKLAEQDPEFYKYLQENDAELLNFDPNAMDVQSDEENLEAVDEDNEKAPVLSSNIIKGWQKALLEHRSLRALRKLLVAFRSAVHMNEENQVVAWSIESSTVFNKLVTTALSYTPVVLAHHVPYKTFPDGKFKAPTQTQKMKTLQKMILSFFHNIIHALGQLTDPNVMKLAVNESAKLLPYVVGSRRTVKMYLKTCLMLWSTADDSVRVASFLAIRRIALAPDEGLLDLVLKCTYLQLVRSAKATSVHTLPSINLMKNSASEIFCLGHAAAYQHAFGYIRQLAIHLRTSMKTKAKESYRQVYNWQFVHSIDFWSLVLARACNAHAVLERGGEESPLQPLIFPLVQVTTGAVKLLNHARSYPFHLHLLRSLVHLTRHTDVYIPLLPYLLPPLTALLTPSHKAKTSTLRPLDFETSLRAPQQYVGTRVYIEGVLDECAFVLADWLTTRAVHGSIAFPEIIVPLVVILRKALKSAKTGKGSGKEVSAARALVERVEESARWVEMRRQDVPFAPGQTDSVAQWEKDLKEKVEDSPLGKYLRIQRKAREKRKKLVEKAREGEDEILNE
ncbi:Noc2-domain-containing protein [Vararia minispora EC-137]|uniref:Noc2-domain-containing protein n=1 Tax=Vararia minispora EC-137 TaxID=1314806 RepID=A0ACB8QGI3_9AGAM|nr:Noc2-domain-containing protein [Vararia minispora EC-137]